ncbi:MAG TPA: DsbC family protein [Smithellaceae bacterium]|nr:DsbC family protein [Smithellaceae bacterium]HPY07296.1 DsbC family protein [Smithellaceae bacterium]HQC10489.1 DsbC family protein [Smithellaceae bacterium]
MKKLMLAGMLLLLFSGCSPAQKISPEERFKKSFPRHSYETITQTSAKGVYEVYNGSQIYYYLPDGDMIFVGSMISKDGTNLTEESNGKKMTSKMAGLSLDKALKIGEGKISVVEFIDPNCHYCRQSHAYFAGRMKEVTLYVFFYPLSRDSEDKIRHIICAADKSGEYAKVLSGELDEKKPLNLCGDKDAEALIAAHREASAKIGVRATPLFYIKGRVVPGFDRPVIEALLKK